MTESNPYIIGLGSAHPPTVVTNAQICQAFGPEFGYVTPSWIERKTGIRERRVSRHGHHDETLSALAYKACTKALQHASVSAEQVDQIIFATCTPQTLIPSTACRLQHQLGAVNAHVFDLNAACSGFLYALELARASVSLGTARVSLVVAGDILSAFTDWSKPRSCILFGDGVGAALVCNLNAPQQPCLRITDISLGATAGYSDALEVRAGGSAIPPLTPGLTQSDCALDMSGHTIRAIAHQTFIELAKETFAKHSLTIESLDWFAPHQANKRIIEDVMTELGFPHKRCLYNLERFGNTSAATIPTLLDENFRQSIFEHGDAIMLAAVGAGMTHGAGLLHYIDPQTSGTPKH